MLYNSNSIKLVQGAIVCSQVGNTSAPHVGEGARRGMGRGSWLQVESLCVLGEPRAEQVRMWLAKQMGWGVCTACFAKLKPILTSALQAPPAKVGRGPEATKVGTALGAQGARMRAVVIVECIPAWRSPAGC